MRDRDAGNGKALSSLRCRNDNSHQFFGCKVPKGILLPEGLCHFAFRRLSEKQKRKTKNSAIFAALR